MLTKHNYTDVDSDKWDEKGLDCCKTTNPGDSTCVDCCYDSWQDELRIVTQKYSKAAEQATQLQNKLTFITARRNIYRKWLDEIDNSEELATAICNQLALLAIQSDKIWYNSCKAVDAVETLFCMIHDFFTQLDLILTQYTDIQNCISNNSDPSLVKGQGILKALDDYKAKLDIVLKLRDDISKSVVTAIQLVHGLANNISTRDCNDKFEPCAKDQQPCAGDDVYYGLKTVICEWYNSFSCIPCKDNGNSSQTNTNTASAPVTTNTVQSDCGDDNCELLPTLQFPICSPGSYKDCVNGWLTADIKTVNDLTALLHDANKEKEALTACKNSLVKAIKAVDPKTRCN
jgi:hypothetical protein